MPPGPLATRMALRLCHFPNLKKNSCPPPLPNPGDAPVILIKPLSKEVILPWSTCFDYKAINYDSCDGMPHMVAAHNTQDYDANETCSILFKTWL